MRTCNADSQKRSAKGSRRPGFAPLEVITIGLKVYVPALNKREKKIRKNYSELWTPKCRGNVKNYFIKMGKRPLKSLNKNLILLGLKVIIQVTFQHSPTVQTVFLQVADILSCADFCMGSLQPVYV